MVHRVGSARDEREGLEPLVVGGLGVGVLQDRGAGSCNGSTGLRVSDDAVGCAARHVTHNLLHVGERRGVQVTRPALAQLEARVVLVRVHLMRDLIGAHLVVRRHEAAADLERVLHAARLRLGIRVQRLEVARHRLLLREACAGAVAVRAHVALRLVGGHGGRQRFGALAGVIDAAAYLSTLGIGG